MPQMNGNHERGIWLWRRHNCASQAIAADMNGVERRFLKTARGYLDDFITRSHGGVKEVPWPDVWQPHVEFPASIRNARSSSNPRTYWIGDPSRSSRGPNTLVRIAVFAPLSSGTVTSRIACPLEIAG